MGDAKLFFTARSKDEHGGNRQGIDSITVDGDTLKVIGWFDTYAHFEASVELTPEERRRLAKAFAATTTPNPHPKGENE